jgi:hypothetical protein
MRWRVMVTAMAVRRTWGAIAHFTAEVTLVMVVVVVAVMLLGEVLKSREGWHALGGELIVVLGSTVVASHAHRALVLAVAVLTATLASHTQDAVLGSGQKTTHASEQELLEALGLAIALLPG